MLKSLQRVILGNLLLIAACLSSGRAHRPEISESVSLPRMGETPEERALAGMARSDWQGILAAHSAWKHAIREAPETGKGWEGWKGWKGWKAFNPETGLWATFDGRGGRVRPESGDWDWGLELTSYGMGDEQRPVGERTPVVETDGRRIGYDWDGNLEEWYRNQSSGLEHGYTIRKRPVARTGAAPLELRLKVWGGLPVVEIVDGGCGATFGRAKGQALVRYSGLKVLDAEGREVVARLRAEGEDELRLVVEEQEASYPLTIDPTISQQAYLKASDTGAGQQFGHAVAISGGTVVVGARYDSSDARGVNGDPLNNNAEESGAAYVFVRGVEGWTQQAYLKASNTGNFDNFGTSVAIAGETIVVGATKEDSNATGVNGTQINDTATNSGAAYIFVRGGTTWTQQAYLKASNTNSSDAFGNSVAIAVNTVVVGAASEASNATGIDGNQLDNSAPDAGAAYVFLRSVGGWAQQAYLKASNTEASDEFGAAVAISGSTLVVGAIGEGSNATGVNGSQTNNNTFAAGAAYVFVRSGSTWTQQAYLKASNTSPTDGFGNSVAIATNTVVVGASGEDSSAALINGDQTSNGALESGAAYVFFRSGTTWTQQAYLKPTNTGAGDRFGYSVGIAGETVVVGAPQEASAATGIDGDRTNNSAARSGAAYVFVRNVTTWSQQAYLKASNTGAEDQFGYSVGISGELVVVGAYLEESNALGVNGDQSNNDSGEAGAAYVYLRSGVAWSQQAYLKASSRGAGGDQFGFAVAIAGETVIVGAPNEDSGATGINGDPIDNRLRDAGAVYVFVRNGATWSQQAYLKASNTNAGDLFGASVALSGETLVVGAYQESSNATGVDGNQFNNSSTWAGAAYVFVRNGTVWTQQAYLKASNTGSGDQFGESLAIAGETIVVGASSEASSAPGVNGNQADNSATRAGAAYVFVRSGTAWSQQAYLKASNPDPSDTFGLSVAISGNTAVVGAGREDSSATGSNGNQSVNSASNAGAAYVFARSGTTWTQQAYLKASNTGAGDQFGDAVAIAGETIVVGARYEASRATGVNGNQADNGAADAGAAYVFLRSGTTWSQQAYLKANDAKAYDYFGYSVAISGETVVVGAAFASSPDVDTGAVYLFARNGTTWIQQGYLKASNAGEDDYFGYSVAIAGQTVVVGAPNEDSSSTRINGDQSDNRASNAGAAYVFTVTPAPPPTIAIAGAITRQAGSSLTGALLATISDQTVVPGSLRVAVFGGTAVRFNGVSLTNLNNTLGRVTADFTVDCGASLGTVNFPLQVSNGETTASAVFSVNVTANTVPVLTYLATEVSTGGGATISPATGPTDQGTVSTIVVESAGTYAGTVSVDAQGRVTLSNARPFGTHTLTIRATDNCGLAASALLQLTVSPPGGVGAVTGPSGTITPSQGSTVGPGNRVTIVQTLTNNTASAITTSFLATLPVGLRALSCSSSIGACLLGVVTRVPGDGVVLDRQSTVPLLTVAQTGTASVSWTGTIPGNGSATIVYEVQVDLQSPAGSQYCISSTIGGGPGPTTCVTVTTPPVAPGTLSIAAGLPNPQKPASVLIYNVYTSSANRASSDTLITLTNTNPANPATISLFFVDGTSGAVADQVVQLTRNQTVSFLTSDYDPGVTGYLIAVSLDRHGCPTVANDLIGGAFLKFESGHRAALPAVGVAGLRIADPPCQSSSLTATLAFDGVTYDELPRALAVPGLPALDNRSSTLLVVNRIGGNLLTGADRLTSLSGLLFDDADTAISFSEAPRNAQLRVFLGDNFPRTVPRYSTLIPAGRTGWMKFWATEVEAISGAVLIESLTGLGGGYNLPSLTTTSRATLTIPVIPPIRP